jgi:hypothetical protein
MNYDTWYKIWCDDCQTVNWVCDGDISDMTQLDIDGFVCRKCRKLHIFDLEWAPSLDAENYEIGLEQSR